MITLFLWVCQIAMANTDSQLWMSTNVRKNVANDLRVEWTQHLRFDANISQIQSIMPEVELRYKPLKPLSLKIGYRYIVERSKSGNFEPAHRYHFQLSTSKKFSVIKVGYRIRYQEKHEEDEFDYTNRLRNKFSLSMDTGTQLTPVLFIETFSDLRAIPIDSSKFRLGTGIDVDVHKRVKCSVEYLYQRDFLRNEQIEHIARLNYQVKLPNNNKDS